jgi:hypothetical protein
MNFIFEFPLSHLHEPKRSDPQPPGTVQSAVMSHTQHVSAAKGDTQVSIITVLEVKFCAHQHEVSTKDWLFILLHKTVYVYRTAATFRCAVTFIWIVVWKVKIKHWTASGTVMVLYSNYVFAALNTASRLVWRNLSVVSCKQHHINCVGS